VKITEDAWHGATQYQKRTVLPPISMDMHVLTASEMHGFSPYMDSKLLDKNC
jgi:hypothetical protein